MACTGQKWKPENSVKIGLPFVVLSVAMSLVGVAAPYWRTGDDRAEGLFYYCNTTTGGCHFLQEIDSGDEGKFVNYT